MIYRILNSIIEMEDLRKNYNVQKGSSGLSINITGWYKSNRSFINLILISLLAAFVIIKPDIVGHYIGYWFNKLYTSFASNLDIPHSDWYLFLITATCFAVIYKIITFNLKKQQ